MIRVTPDIASVHLGVSASAKKPKPAFEEVRKAAQNVRNFLSGASVQDLQASRISLAEQWAYTDGIRKRQGYTARVNFNLVLEDLDCIEEIICGAVDAGANEVGKVDFLSRQLKDQRVRARQQAVAAAQEKAKVYADAAGVALGTIVHIEDVNPNQLQGSEGHVVREIEIDDEGPVTAFEPGSIVVSGAVILSYSLASP